MYRFHATFIVLRGGQEREHPNRRKVRKVGFSGLKGKRGRSSRIGGRLRWRCRERVEYGRGDPAGDRSGGRGEGDEAAREGSLQRPAKKRGPKPSGGKREARKVPIIIDVQGKVAGLLGVSPGDGERS